jgi:hypothetical protein
MKYKIARVYVSKYELKGTTFVDKYKRVAL